MYASCLLREVRKLQSQAPIRIEAVGGRLLKESGAYMVADSTKWGAMGIIESAKVFPRLAKSYLRTKKALRIGEPGLFVPIDFGFMNVKLARFSRALGWKVLYFMPPGSWRRKIHGESLPGITDEIVTPFRWSCGLLNTMGASAHWYGHPLKQIMLEDTRPSEAETSTTIAVLPGSRHHEIKLNLPTIAQATERISRSLGLEIALAPSVDRNRFIEQWRRHTTGGHQVVFTSGDTRGVLKRARAAIVVSGTATLEAALLRCPMVVMYRLSKTMEMEARLLRLRPQFFALPNIVANRLVVPELIQREASPKHIAIRLLELVDDGPERHAQLEGFKEIDEELGPEDALTETAKLVLKMLAD